MADSGRPRTTSQRLPLPYNGTLYTTDREIPAEKALPEIGSKMGPEIGVEWMDSVVVASSIVPVGKESRPIQRTVHAIIPTIAEQESSNFEFTSVDIGTDRFDGVSRTYIYPRADFNEGEPVAGSPMPVGPDDKFKDLSYILIKRTVIKTGLEIEPYFQVERRDYIKRDEILAGGYDPKSGETNSVRRKLYYRGETVEGTAPGEEEEDLAIEALAEDPDNAYWQGDGSTVTGREFTQLSDDWWAIDESLYKMTDLVFENQEYDQDLGAFVKITRQAVLRGTVSPSVEDGKVVEVRSHDTIYDFVLTSELVLPPGDALSDLGTTLPAVFNYNFPARLESVEIVGVKAWAYTTSGSFLTSFAQDQSQYMRAVITDPGTVAATGRIRRVFVYKSGLSSVSVTPHNWKAQAVSFGLVGSSSWASTDLERSHASAIAAQYHIPPTIHGTITISITEVGGASSGSTPAGTFNFYPSGSQTIASTGTSIPTWITIDVDVIPRRLGIFEVVFKEVNTSGVYS